jgi:hypothetical protein
MPKLCEFENCRNRASYGLYFGKPSRCGDHKENLKPQYAVCQCGQGSPIYNFEDEKGEYCSKCKKEDMINVVTKRCNCGKGYPIYNFEGLKPIYCRNCPEFEEKMIVVSVPKCQCGKSQPHYNYKGLRPKFCAKCKNDGMEIVTNKLCKCGKSQPNFNLPGLPPEFCKQCKTEGMENIKAKRCKCGKIACFNLPGLPPVYCNECKEDDKMVNVIAKKCQCGKSQPRFNIIGKSPEYCKKCKTEDMENLVTPKCPGQHGKCIQTSNRKYRGYCSNCFRHYFPLDPLTFQIRCKTKEIAVRDFINANFEGFHHDKPLFTGNCDCTHRRRIDHRKLIGNTLLCIETDENQHKRYNTEDEEIRYDDLYMVYSGKWIFIRFNPDKYKDKSGRNKNPSISTRLTVLKKEIKKQIERIQNEENKDLVEIIKLYYDEK